MVSFLRFLGQILNPQQWYPVPDPALWPSNPAKIDAHLVKIGIIFKPFKELITDIRGNIKCPRMTIRKNNGKLFHPDGFYADCFYHGLFLWSINEAYLIGKCIAKRSKDPRQEAIPLVVLSRPHIELLPECLDALDREMLSG